MVDGGYGLERQAETARRRIYIFALRPEVDGGRFPAKVVAGDALTVEADLIADGHDELAGVARFRREGETGWREATLSLLGNDRWRATWVVPELGAWSYCVQAWIDEPATWRRGLARRVEAGQDVRAELEIGARLYAAAAERAAAARDADGAALLRATAAELAGDAPIDRRVAAASDDAAVRCAARHPDRSRATESPQRALVAERERARYGAWYELFPRSCGPRGQHGTLRDAEARLAYVADLGFDVLYLPPVHPIGRTHRKGRDNRTTAEPSEPGSPWAIGAAEGGHKAIHPELGTLDDFDRFRAAAERHGLELALDIALQASPDHPYVTDHPEWFHHLPDGTIRYAENPPKRYQDIYPLDFDSDAWPELWRELLDVFVFWMKRGVRLFRVDNPHTKSLRFWEWCIGELRRLDPRVVLLAEAFARPKLMYALAKVGFSQSYTYFTWRTTRRELTDYLVELTRPPVSEFLRPNLWPNTPDILPEHLQMGGRPAFEARLVLAATLSASYGIYGPPFELMESEARPGSGEYAGNEKYQLRAWDVGPDRGLAPLIRRVNRIRRDNPALRGNDLTFHDTDNDYLLCYSKRDPSGDNTILAAVNLDPYHRHAGWVHLDLRALGLDADQGFQVHDLLSDARYMWTGARQYLELSPDAAPAHVMRLRRLVRREHDFEYFQ